MLSEWAGVPSQQAHVLLDRDGKTLSHAFIEAHPQAAREILVTCRNKVLGHGRRARRVTLTTSSQDELLQQVHGGSPLTRRSYVLTFAFQLFTGWTGKFLNGHASVAHLGPQQIPTLLNNGILPLPELEILAKRILQPDVSH
ncbi:hypothetical protein DL93DRAFT_2081138 [Clavulina sp. PMI_390]|nr:hypothetical protein DL93DRAFT_2081138 [Clavulina sp. PMI_390]